VRVELLDQVGQDHRDVAASHAPDDLRDPHEPLIGTGLDAGPTVL
jgi:hypothetical protein